MFSECTSHTATASANATDASKFLPSAQSRSRESGPSQSSRLYFSAADILPEDDNPRSIYSPRRNWAVSSTRPQRFERAQELREDDEEDNDELGPIPSKHALAEEAPQTSRVFAGKRSRLFFKSPPAGGSTILGASSIARDDFGDDEHADMAGTYTGHLYGADSVIQSSWKALDEDEGENSEVRPKAADAKVEASLVSSRNSMESIGLESVMSRTRQQSPPPARLRFNEHPFPRNMIAATTQAATARRHVFVDEYEDDEAAGRRVSEDYDNLSQEVAIEMPPVLSERPKDLDDMLVLPVSDSLHIPLPAARRQAEQRVVSEGFVPPKLTDRADMPSLDTVWSKFYVVSMCCLLATSFIVWLETEVTAPMSMTDSIYSVVGGSVSILALDTLFAMLISVVWFTLLKTSVRPVLYMLVVAIPFMLVGLSMYPLVMSYRDSWGGNTAQDRAMRWTSLVPAVFAAFWVFAVVRSRGVLGRAVGIVQLACKIMGENPSLVVLSMGTLLSFVLFTWVWFAMFTRVFLKGTVVVGTSGISTWILDRNSWVLSAWYVLMYLWSWGVFSGVQRLATAVTVAQWYFHRASTPRAGSLEVLSAAVGEASSTFAGTICFASFLALLMRVPVLVLPSRVTRVVQAFWFSLVPGPLSALTNPLTVTYAGMAGQALVPSSRGIANLRYLDLSPSSFEASWTAYRFAKMLLSSARALTALVLGFGAWVRAAQDVHGGSLYGYVVGLMAAAIGWVVLGATEGSLSMIVDSSFVGFAIDHAGSHGGHCREADLQFGSG